ncbi:hypothetical protein A0H81_11226 [Grifola frondosa]|uniref:Uncharacterized protein n=1 Tax=Grifola frondosa TaxID=5627 RepID=A0A1C7LX95_GRIFR|nr:hypothetical protein A0H81_11226 [Grifola frondosa]
MVSWIADATFDQYDIEPSYQAQSSAPYEFDVAMDEDMRPQTTSAQVASEMPVEIFLSTISLPLMAEDCDLPDYDDDDDDTGASTQSLLFVPELSLSHVPHGPNQPDHSAPGIDVDEDVVPITTHQSRWGFSLSRNETWTALRLDEQVEYVWPTEEPAAAADEELVHDIFIDDTSAIVHSPKAVVSDMIIVSSDGDEDRETVEDKLWRKVLRLNAWLSSIMRGGTGGDIDTNDESGVLLTEGRRDVLMFFNQQLHCTKWTKTMERHYRLTGRWRREEQERHAREEMEREGDAEDEDQDAAKENEQPKVGHLRKQDDDVVKALTAQMRNQLSIELVPLGTTTSRLGHGEHASVDNSEGDNLATALAGITLATQDN